MSFLAPLFFLGLGAIAVPILVHLIQRERSRLVRFPSLMFVRRIPYQSVRRRKIRHWYLLMMRAAAIALIVAAFTRPFFRQNAAAAALTGGGTREVVVLLDQSASMAYGDHWARAQEAALDAVRSLVGADRATFVLFGQGAEEHIRATSDIGRLEGAINTAQVTSGATRYGPALELAESILMQSTRAAQEVVLISDFQRSGWAGVEEVRFGDNVVLTPVAITTEGATNLSIPSVVFDRTPFSGQERITVTSAVSNRGAESASAVPVVLEIDGLEVERQTVTVAPNASASVAFAPFTLAEEGAHGIIRAGPDPFDADNAFHFVLTPSRPVSVLIVDNGGVDSTFYLTRALAIGNAPAFDVEIVTPGRVTPAMLDTYDVVVLNDTIVPLGVGAAGLERYVDRGGGVFVVLGERSSWPTSEAEVIPGRIGAPVDRTGRSGTIGFIDYSHPVFEVFKAPRSGDFSAARIMRYRALETDPDALVLARFDDGGVAAAERRIGGGRMIVLTTPLDDSWNDLALKPVYLPLVHRVVRYLARYEAPTAWLTVGQVVDLASELTEPADRVIVAPSNEQRKVTVDDPGLLELTEQGVYEIRSAASAGNPYRIAVNLDPAESDLSRLDPAELVAAVTGRATQDTVRATGPAELSPEESEGQQGLWWYLLLGGLTLLAAETIVANRLSRRERFL